MLVKSSALLFKRASPSIGLRAAVTAASSNPVATQSATFFLPVTQQSQALRWFSADNRTGGADQDSHDDFQPKSKAQTTDEVTEHISKWVSENDVCLFMKGTRKMPQCGFSRTVVALLNAYGVKTYKDVNVLADETLRATIKEYSNWPTIPQVYIKGEFIGGLDIMMEMHEDGSLRELLIQEKIIKE